VDGSDLSENLTVVCAPLLSLSVLVMVGPIWIESSLTVVPVERKSLSVDVAS